MKSGDAHCVIKMFEVFSAKCRNQERAMGREMFKHQKEENEGVKPREKSGDPEVEPGPAGILRDTPLRSMSWNASL